jgi:hypothetical protein
MAGPSAPLPRFASKAWEATLAKLKDYSGVKLLQYIARNQHDSGIAAHRHRKQRLSMAIGDDPNCKIWPCLAVWCSHQHRGKVSRPLEGRHHDCYMHSRKSLFALREACSNPMLPRDGCSGCSFDTFAKRMQLLQAPSAASRVLSLS